MKPNEEFYEKVPPEYYEELPKNGYNPMKKWFHKKRYKIMQDWVKTEWKEGMSIVDLGCGSCAWNKEKFPVTGVDINKPMLQFGKEKGYLKDFIRANVDNTTLPEAYADIIILSEIIEHVDDPQKVLAEVKRIAKPTAKIFISVPYDKLLSLWYPLFNLQCIVLGFFMNKSFYKDFGGHVNHFSPQTIAKTIKDANLNVLKQFHNHRLTIYTICTKNPLEK